MGTINSYPLLFGNKFDGSPAISDWYAYLKFGTRQFYKKNTIIYKQETFGDGFYFVFKGFVKMSTSTLKGNERLLNIAFPGHILGIQAIDKNRYATTAVTAMDSVLYFFSSDQIRKMIQVEPESLNLIYETVNRNIHVLLQNIDLNTMTPKQRIAFVLHTYYIELKKNKVYLTIQDIASYTGVTRITVYKTLKEWEQKGIIYMEAKKFELKKPELLMSIL